jgi:acetylornithine deacetylase/succinyl-diaminopimelate desuccinylase-like protein
MTQWNDTIAAENENLLAQLFEWLRIPSISADPAYDKETLYAAEWLQNLLLKAGVDRCELWETSNGTEKGHPVVYAEKIVDPSLPTLLVYGHYDVQPPDPLDLWTTPAFEPNIRDGKIYARGACDDKGQTFLHVAALQLLQKNGSLPCNLKYLIEGEEEVGSPNLGAAIKAHKDQLTCDAIVISDTSILATDKPSLTVALRGLSYLEVTVTAFNRDLHSGVYGGAVDNPINALCSMIAKLKDENGHITIPGFYESVVVHDTASREKLNNRTQDDTAYALAIGAPRVYGEKDFTTIERIGIRPCLDVNGIWGGYTGAGAKTVLPAQAHAKISMRLVPHQDPDVVTQQITTYLQDLCPPTMQLTVAPHHGGEPFLTNVDGKAYKAAAKAFEAVWGKEPIPAYEGASIPIAALLQREVSPDLVFLGFGLDTDAIHSPNEHFRVDHFTKGLETVIAFYQQFGQS